MDSQSNNFEEPPIMDPFQECQDQMRNFEINDRPPSFRHSRAFRNFKNPPQPHMCIRDKTVDGDQEVLINVMSWTRIVKPQTPNDPIPLYGGMRVLASSNNRLHGSPPQQQRQLQQSQAMLFAVMANPEVLKKASRNNVDDQDLTALVELMCEFVEAMNPGLKLLRQPVVLKDRDLSGELKNIWGAVQAKRETEREQFMISTGKHNPNLVVYTELGPESAPSTTTGHSANEENGQNEFDGGGESEEDRRGEYSGRNGDSTTEQKESADEHDKGSSNYSSSSHSRLSDHFQERRCTKLVDHLVERHFIASTDPSSEVACNNININGSGHMNDSNGSDSDHSFDQELQVQQPVNVPQDSKLALNELAVIGLSKKTATESGETPIVPKEEPPNDVLPATNTVQILGNGGGTGKAEKEVANVKEKKEKSISGFLQNGLFGKRNKDKDSGGTKKESKPKLGSFKSKLLMSGNKEKEDKGIDVNAKKLRGGGAPAPTAAGEETNSQFSEIGQSMTTAK